MNELWEGKEREGEGRGRRGGSEGGERGGERGTLSTPQSSPAPQARVPVPSRPSLPPKAVGTSRASQEGTSGAGKPPPAGSLGSRAQGNGPPVPSPRRVFNYYIKHLLCHSQIGQHFTPEIFDFITFQGEGQASVLIDLHIKYISNKTTSP